MRYMFTSIALTVAVAVPMTVMAQAPENSDEQIDLPRGPNVRARLLNAFDKDEDGTLDEEERKAMREHFRERANRRSEEGRERGDEESRAGRDDEEERRDRDRDRAAEGRRRPDGDRDRDREGRRGPRRDPDGRGARSGRMPRPPGPPLAPLFDWFDGDSDDKLSRDEFAALSDFVRHHRLRRPGGSPDGPRLGDRRLDGASRMERLRRGDGRGTDGPPRDDRQRRGGRRDEGGRGRDADGPRVPPARGDASPGSPTEPVPAGPSLDETA